MQETYTIGRDSLDHHFRMARNRYADLFKIIGTRINSTARENPAVNEMTDLVMNQAYLFAGVTEAVKNAFQRDKLVQSCNEKTNALNAYAANISARTVVKDLESKVEENYSTMVRREKNTLPMNAWDQTDYEKVKSVLHSLVDNLINSKDARTSNIVSFYKDYIRSSDVQLQRRLPNGLYSKLKDITWKIDSYEIEGLTRLVDETKEDPPAKTEELFHTPLKYLTIPEDKRLPRSRIIGDPKIFNTVENMVKCLFLYNKHEKKNAMQAKGLFHNKMLFQGMPGTGKSTICFYAIDYAEKISKRLDQDLTVAELDVDSHWQSGHLKKLKSQLNQIVNEDRLYIIFLDEMTELFRNTNGTNNGYREDLNLEIQKFLDGQYVNKGNYIFISTTNKYNEIPMAIRNRMNTFAWRGAVSPEQKGTLLKYKLEEGIEAGYVRISDDDFLRLGKVAYDNDLAGREMTIACSNLRQKKFSWDNLGAVYQNMHDYESQLNVIDSMFSDITFDKLEGELMDIAKQRDDAIRSSDKYTRGR